MKKSTKIRSAALALFAAAISSISLGTLPSQAADYFAGKTVTVLVGLRAGGVVDRTARAFSAAWEKRVPGGATFIVKNMPGSGGIKAMNYVYEKAAPDGLTLFWGPWVPVAQALGEPYLRAKQEKFAFLGGIADLRVSYVRTDAVPSGMKKPTDIMKAVGLKDGGTNPAGTADLTASMPLDVLGVPHKHVTGYRGGTAVFAALKRGELNLQNTSITSYRIRVLPMVKTGEVMPLYYLAYVDKTGKIHNSPYIKHIPSFPEFYKEINGKMPSGRRWESLNWLTGVIGEMTFVGFAPPKTPAKVVNVLRKTFIAACNDESFQGQAKKRYGLPYTCVDIKDGEEMIKSLANVSPAVVKDLRKVVSENAGKL